MARHVGSGGSSSRRDVTVPKIIGSDFEHGNALLGVPGGRFGTGDVASRLLLREIDGIRQNAYSPVSTGSTHASQQGQGPEATDWGRKFLANAGCAYIDLGHLELCTPEVLSAFSFVAARHAMLRLGTQALQRANARLPEGQRLVLYAGNSDGFTHGFGTHMSYLLKRDAFTRIASTKLHQLLWLATFQVSSIVWQGQGKVLCEGSWPDDPVPFQISARADFYERLASTETVYIKPVMNLRDESLTGLMEWLARLHVIFFDAPLCDVNCALTAGVPQLVLCQLEDERGIDAGLILEDPLASLRLFSRDPSLKARARTLDGRCLTAVEIQEAIHEGALKYMETTDLSERVPRAREIADLWGDTLGRLRAADLGSLASRVDWILKKQTLEGVMSQQGLDYSDPQVKLLDHMFSSLDPASGLFLRLRERGAVELLTTEEEIGRCMTEAPETSTRAWLRSRIVRGIDPALVTHMDWDSVTLGFPFQDAGLWPYFRYYTLRMDRPWADGDGEETARVLDESGSLVEALCELGLEETNAWGRPLRYAAAAPGSADGECPEGQHTGAACGSQGEGEPTSSESGDRREDTYEGGGGRDPAASASEWN